jgi:hypothetical protein
MFVTSTPSSSKSSLDQTLSDNGFLESSSPLGFAGGQSNLTEYVGNSPTNATDPTGLEAVDDGSGYTDDIGASFVTQAVGLMTSDGGSGGSTVPVFAPGGNESGLAGGGGNSAIVLIANNVPPPKGTGAWGTYQGKDVFFDDFTNGNSRYFYFPNQPGVNQSGWWWWYDDGKGGGNWTPYGPPQGYNFAPPKTPPPPRIAPLLPGPAGKAGGGGNLVPAIPVSPPQNKGQQYQLPPLWQPGSEVLPYTFAPKQPKGPYDDLFDALEAQTGGMLHRPKPAPPQQDNRQDGPYSPSMTPQGEPGAPSVPGGPLQYSVPLPHNGRATFHFGPNVPGSDWMHPRLLPGDLRGDEALGVDGGWTF